MSSPAANQTSSLLSNEEVLEIIGRTVLDQSASGIVIATPETRLLAGSQAFYHIFGLDPHAPLAGVVLADLIHPEDRARFLADYNTESPPGQRRLYRAVRPDGRGLEIDARMASREFHGELYCLAALSDVTEQLEVERALRRSEERFRVAAQMVSDYVYEWDPATMQLEWSRSIDELLGYEPGEFPHDLWGANDLIHPDDRQRVMEDLGNSLVSGNAFEQVYRIRKSDGTYITVLSRAQPVFDDDGKLVRWIGVNTDITRQRVVESALEETQEKFRSFVTESAYGYVEFDLEGNFVYANQKAEEISGYKLSDYPQLNFRDFLVAEDLERAVRDLGRVFREPNNGPREYRFRNRQGEIRDAAINTLPVRKKGTIVGFQCTILDVTDRRRMEDELRHREAILQAVADVSELLLRSSSWDANIEAALSMIGESSRVDRIFIFQNALDGQGRTYMNIRAQWNSPDAQAMKDSFNSHPIPYDDHPLKRLLAMLELGEAVYGHLKDFLPHERAMLEMTGAKSVIVVPVFVRNDWWGGIGFNECREERDWSPAEIDVLKALAGVLGGVIQRQRSEEAIRESENKYRLVVENASDVIWTFDLDFKLNFVSPSVERSLGYTVEEILNTGPFDRIAPSYHAKIRKIIADALAAIPDDSETDTNWLMGDRIEVEMVHKDGHYVPIEIHWAYLRDHDKKIIGFQGVSRNIAERRRAEAALRESERKYRLVVENARDVIWTATPGLVFTYISPSIEQLLGYTVDEIRSERLEKFMSRAGLALRERNHKAAVEALDRERLTGKRTDIGDRFEIELFRKDGGTVWTEVNWDLVRDEAGNPLGLQGVLHDITDRRRSEIELKQREALSHQVALAAEKLLQAKDWREHVDEILAQVGKVFEVSRVLVFEHGRGEQFQLLSSPIHVWEDVESIKKRFSPAGYSSIDFASLGWPELISALERREVYSANLDEIPSSQRKFFAELGLQSMLAVPIFVEDEPWGFVGFEDNKPRSWSGARIDIVKTLANTIAAAISRQRVEDSIRESEQRYRLITENITDVVWMMTPDLTFSYVSPSIKTLTGFEPEEFLSLPPREYLPNASRKILKNAHKTTMNLIEEFHRTGEVQRELVRAEFEFIHKDGRSLWVEVSWMIVGDDSGDLIGVQGVTRDITERKQAEEALLDSEQRYRIAADLASDLIYEWKPMEGELKWIGDVDRIFGYEPGEFPRNIFEQNKLVHREDRPHFLAAIKRFIEEGGSFEETYRVRKKDGTYATVSSRATSIRNDKGEILRWIGVNQDITDRKQSLELIQASEERFRVAAGLASDVIYEWEPGEDHNRWFGDVDKMFGYAPGEFPRTMFGQNSLIHRDDRARVFEAMERLIRDNVSFNEEYRVRRQDGGYVVIASRAATVRNERGEIVRWIGVNSDITERKRADEALKLSEERARAQYNAIPVPTYTWQREGRDFILTSYNAAAQKITLGKIKDFVGFQASRMYADQPDIISDLERCYQDRSTFEREMHYHYQSTGLEKYLVVKYAFVAPDQVIAHTEDITDKRLALEAAAEAERRLQQTLSAELSRRRSKDYSSAGEDEDRPADLEIFPSPAMRKVLTEARIAAENDITVLLLGKSGVGKTYLAGWIHHNSRRAPGPFFDINCAALTPSLIESELFGHEAGAFTGSKGRKRGLIELAHSGTLFLDEIGDMPLDLQAKLLNFLDSKKLMRVGGETKIQVDARIIVATNRDLAAQVRKGHFREDLYYRLNVLAITVPTLLERKQDLPVLAAEVLKRLAHEMGLAQPPVLSPDALRVIQLYDWPGNVRELRNILERSVLRAENKSVINDIPLMTESLSHSKTQIDGLLSDAEGKLGERGQNFDQAIDNYMISLIKAALRQSRNNIEAAEILGISRHALNRYLKRFEINARKTRK